MSISDATNLYNLVERAGPGAGIIVAIVLAIVVAGAVRGWWYSAPAYQALDAAWQARFKERDEQWTERFSDMKAEAESWKMLALSTGRTAAASVQMAEAAIRTTPAP